LLSTILFVPSLLTAVLVEKPLLTNLLPTTRFLGCDKYGIFSATSEAVSPLESFTLVATADTPGTFQVQTLRETYLSVRPSTSSRANALPEVRGDATDMSFDTTLRIRMQARFKPRIRATKEEKAREKISRRELEEAAGRRLDEDEVRMLKRARREGDYHEKLLDLKTKNKHDKYG
jgi:protein FRG1